MKEISAANCKLSDTAPLAALAQPVFSQVCNRNPIYMLGAKIWIEATSQYRER